MISCILLLRIVAMIRFFKFIQVKEVSLLDGKIFSKNVWVAHKYDKSCERGLWMTEVWEILVKELASLHLLSVIVLRMKVSRKWSCVPYMFSKGLRRDGSSCPSLTPAPLLNQPSCCGLWGEAVFVHDSGKCIMNLEGCLQCTVLHNSTMQSRNTKQSTP